MKELVLIDGNLARREVEKLRFMKPLLYATLKKEKKLVNYWLDISYSHPKDYHHLFKADIYIPKVDRTLTGQKPRFIKPYAKPTETTIEYS